MQHFWLCLSVLPYELIVAQSSMGPEASLHKSLPLDLILNVNSVPTFLFKIRLNINNEFVAVFPKSDYPTRILSVLLTCPIDATCYVY